MSNTADFLKKVEIFSLLDDAERWSISELFKNKFVRREEILFREGENGNELFIVKSGKMASSIRLSNGEFRELAEFSCGNFFGEMSIFENALRSATCICKDDAELLSLNKRDFFEMIERHSAISVKIMYRMLNITTQRLRDTSEFLSDMVHWGEAARKRAITDELTGAYNRRFLDDAMDNYFESARTNGRGLSLIMVDLDHFREINEYFGHKGGDSVILEVVKIFNKHLRDKDILARYGGDEFTVLMPEIDALGAMEIAEKIRADVEMLDLFPNSDVPIKKISTSQGIASFPEHANDIKVLKQKADQALYRAKEEGRNRVISTA
jgi:diguanylate cyclase (GGDEF)-like protein